MVEGVTESVAFEEVERLSIYEAARGPPHHPVQDSGYFGTTVGTPRLEIPGEFGDRDYDERTEATGIEEEEEDDDYESEEDETQSLWIYDEEPEREAALLDHEPQILSEWHDLLSRSWRDRAGAMGFQPGKLAPLGADDDLASIMTVASRFTETLERDYDEEEDGQWGGQFGWPQ